MKLEITSVSKKLGQRHLCITTAVCPSFFKTDVTGKNQGRVLVELNDLDDFEPNQDEKVTLDKNCVRTKTNAYRIKD